MLNENQSEVARIRERIELETQAIAVAMNGPAISASHDAIQARYRNLGKAHDELVSHVGEEKAIEIVFEAYQRSIG